MTEEEARAEAEEARRLLAEINHLENQIERAVIEKKNLQEELAVLVLKSISLWSMSKTVLCRPTQVQQNYLLWLMICQIYILHLKI